jgi:regulator of replication initiation timing
LWRPDGNADLASIVAFSSQIAGKTTGQLMHPGAVGPHNAYVQMPNGSAEDMIAALYQSRKGEIYVNEQVHIIDQDRPNPDASLRQQLQWGEDHVYLQNALAQVGAQQAGILVLEPMGQGWVEWVAVGTEDVSGVVVYPAQLRRLLTDLHAQQAHECAQIQDNSFLQLESTRLANVLTILEERRAKSNMIIRTDLPHHLDEVRKDGRYTDVAQTGRLLGNMAGVHALHACDNAFTIPSTFLYGMRQSACW